VVTSAGTTEAITNVLHAPSKNGGALENGVC
jgi:hypothetical protein